MSINDGVLDDLDGELDPELLPAIDPTAPEPIDPGVSGVQVQDPIQTAIESFQLLVDKAVHIQDVVTLESLITAKSSISKIDAHALNSLTDNNLQTFMSLESFTGFDSQTNYYLVTKWVKNYRMALEEEVKADYNLYVSNITADLNRGLTDVKDKYVPDVRLALIKLKQNHQSSLSGILESKNATVVYKDEYVNLLDIDLLELDLSSMQSEFHLSESALSVVKTALNKSKFKEFIWSCVENTGFTLADLLAYKYSDRPVAARQIIEMVNGQGIETFLDSIATDITNTCEELINTSSAESADCYDNVLKSASAINKGLELLSVSTSVIDSLRFLEFGIECLIHEIVKICK